MIMITFCHTASFQSYAVTSDTKQLLCPYIVTFVTKHLILCCYILLGFGRPQRHYAVTWYFLQTVVPNRMIIHLVLLYCQAAIKVSNIMFISKTVFQSYSFTFYFYKRERVAQKIIF